MSRLLLAVALISLTFLGSCGAEAPESGERLYVKSGCVSCHGATGMGGPLGPSIRGASEHWTRESLLEFLKDPRGTVGSNPRLAAVGENYRAQMPAFVFHSDDKLERIADYVLTLD